MSDQSPDSPETPTPTSPFGKKEIDYLTRVEAAMQNPVQSSTVKMSGWRRRKRKDWTPSESVQQREPESLIKGTMGTTPSSTDPRERNREGRPACSRR